MSEPDINLEDDAQNYLYYMAKNLAVENMLKNLEHYFSSIFAVKAKWKEDSFSEGTIELEVHYRKSYDIRRIGLGRTSKNQTSPIDHVVRDIQHDDYYAAGKKPKYVQTFDDILASSEFRTFIEEQVENCNYPFKYQHMAF